MSTRQSKCSDQAFNFFSAIPNGGTVRARDGASSRVQARLRRSFARRGRTTSSPSDGRAGRRLRQLGYKSLSLKRLASAIANHTIWNCRASCSCKIKNWSRQYEEFHKKQKLIEEMRNWEARLDAGTPAPLAQAAADKKPP